MKSQSPNIVNWLTNTTRKSNRADSKTGSIDLEKRQEKESVRREIYWKDVVAFIWLPIFPNQSMFCVHLFELITTCIWKKHLTGKYMFLIICGIEVLYIYSTCRPHETRVSIGKMRRVPLWESSERSMSLIVTKCLIHYKRVNNYVWWS